MKLLFFIVGNFCRNNYIFCIARNWQDNVGEGCGHGGWGDFPHGGHLHHREQVAGREREECQGRSAQRNIHFFIVFSIQCQNLELKHNDMSMPWYGYQ